VIYKFRKKGLNRISTFPPVGYKKRIYPTQTKYHLARKKNYVLKIVNVQKKFEFTKKFVKKMLLPENNIFGLIAF